MTRSNIEGDEAYTGPGRLVNSGWMSGMSVDEAKAAVIAKAQHEGWGTGETQYRLRDWGVSRQRYWGTPIPFIHCETCGVVPVPKEQLPVVLPEDVDFSDAGQSAAAPSRRGSMSLARSATNQRRARPIRSILSLILSWYFLRFASQPGDAPFDPEAIAKWLPVEQYIGGIEHAILHLLYARFWTRALGADRQDQGQGAVRQPVHAGDGDA